MRRAIRLYLQLLSRSRMAILGAVLVTTGLVADTILLFVSMLLLPSNPYLGIFAYGVFPGMIVAGLALIPAGLLRVARTEGDGGVLEGVRSVAGRVEPDAVRRVTVVVVLLSLVNLLVFGVVGYRGYHYMDSTEFCGLVCHQVMRPEYTTYQRSPHSEVPCVDCHIGPGADWFVKSKLSGTRQVFAVALDSYPRPIPAPVENLRPARETCERCHRPQLFHGNHLKVFERFGDDEASTKRYTVLNLKVGGGNELGRVPHGIHWHVSQWMNLRYVAQDHSRERVLRIDVTDAHGKTTTWTRDGAEAQPPPDAVEREMDCVDCHNRPTHRYLSPEQALDERLAVGAIDPRIPWIKREALALLRVDYATVAAAETGIRALTDGYEERHPEAWARHQDSIRQAAGELLKTWRTFVYPDMGIRWDTYQSQRTHRGDVEGCYRCHNDALKTAEGKAVRSDCELCHHTLAVDQPDPEIFRYLKADKSVKLF